MDREDVSTILSEILSCAHDAIGEKFDEIHGEIMEALFPDESDLDDDEDDTPIASHVVIDQDDDETQVDGLPTRVALAWSILLAQHRDNVEVPHAIHRASVDAVRVYMEGARNE